MRRTSVCLSLLAIFVAGFPAFAQSRRILSGTAAPTNATYAFYFEAQLEPPTPEIENLGGGVVCCTNNIVHRYMTDYGRRVYFGYDVAIEPQTEPNTYRLSFSPLTLSPQQIVRDNPAAWTTFSTPGWGGPPSPRTVRAGEVVVLNLLTNRATGQQITDYVTVQEPPRPAVASFSNGNRPPREFAFEDGQARDFRVEDAEMRLRDPRLTVNGKFQSGTASLNTEVKGAVVWFYAPSRGRYLLSLSTHPGFSKAGEVRGTTLNFVDGKDAFNLVAAGPIAPGDAAFTLYVAHDPSWKPTYPNADTNAFILGAADRAEYLRR